MDFLLGYAFFRTSRIVSKYLRVSSGKSLAPASSFSLLSARKALVV